MKYYSVYDEEVDGYSIVYKKMKKKKRRRYEKYVKHYRPYLNKIEEQMQKLLRDRDDEISLLIVLLTMCSIGLLLCLI